MIPRNNLTSSSPLDVLQRLEEGKIPNPHFSSLSFLRIHHHRRSKLLASLIPMIADNLLIIINLYSRRARQAILIRVKVHSSFPVNPHFA